jgi:hypothetical protein
MMHYDPNIIHSFITIYQAIPWSKNGAVHVSSKQSEERQSECHVACIFLPKTQPMIICVWFEAYKPKSASVFETLTRECSQ